MLEELHASRRSRPHSGVSNFPARFVDDQYIERFDSIVVFQDASAIPSSDLRRLMNAANDMVDSIDAKAALAKKIHHRMRAA
ncbi:hypothetical protein [Caballeronia sp. INDeC2]|uniref:hypothetical protein n=1 Tax=Caballeronia sp. INDeC2 TaxID=2921747 RepID=UPI0020294F9D|nr:hypothetical protein [Caballeronia sp. INDeC2]